MKILVATDGSVYSSAAVDHLCHRVLKPGDEVLTVSVVEAMAHVVGAPFGVVDEYYSNVMAERNETAEKTAHAAAAKIGSAVAGVSVSENVLLGSPARAIVEEAERFGAELIVVGSHGAGFWERMLIGSVSQAVTSHAACSVLVVRK